MHPCTSRTISNWPWILRRFYIIISICKVITKNLFSWYLIHELINHVRQIDAQTDRQTDAISEYLYGYMSSLSVRISWNDVDNLMIFQIHHDLISKQFSWDGSYEWLLNPILYRLHALIVCTALSETLLSRDISSRREAIKALISTTFLSAHIQYFYV